MEDKTKTKDKKLSRSSGLSASEAYVQLHEALKNSDIKSFEKLLTGCCGNFDVNQVSDDSDSETLLDKACRTQNLKNRSDFVRLLIKHGADVNKANKVRKKTPLHSSVESSDLKTLQCLLNSPNIDVNVPDSTGRTALHLASKEGKLEEVKLLLNHPKIMVNALDEENRTPIQLAREKRNIVSELLKHEDTIDSVSQLFAYLYECDLDSFEKLIKDEPQLVNSDDGYETFLQYACQRNLCDFVSLLLRLGADINHTCKNNDKSALMLACQQGHHEIVKLLIAKQLSAPCTEFGTFE